MSGMRTVVVDKIASVTQACGLSHEIRIAADIACEEGMVVVVEILNNKSTYNTLELTSGRMAKLARGDVVIGALGHRKALFGYSGHIPQTLQPGDVIHSLNNQPVGSLETFRTVIDGLKTAEPVALLVERSGTFRYVAFEIE